MQNKDGIEIEVGQVWDGDELKEMEVVGFFEKGVVPYVVCRCDRGDPLYEGYPTGGLYFEKLTKTTDGIDLKRARIGGWEIWVAGMKEPDAALVGNVELFETWDGVNEWQPCSGSWAISVTYRYKLKPQEPEQPERLELKILRGFARDMSAAPDGGVGVNKIKQAVNCMMSEYNLIGYRYAESRYISTFGPNAWWKDCLTKECCVHYNNGNEYYPIFATHAIYQRVK